MKKPDQRIALQKARWPGQGKLRMPKPIITSLTSIEYEKKILHLPEALERSTNGRVVLYGRASELAQVKRGALDTQWDAVYGAVKSQRIKGRKMILCAKVFKQERGKLSGERRHLLKAIKHAQKHGAFILANDVTRLIRAEAFDKQKNWEAQPTPEEIAALIELADGIDLATVIHPETSAKELHSIATKRGGNCGRPSTIDDELLMRTLWLCQKEEWSTGWVVENPTSMAKLAEKLGITKSKFQKIVGQQIPDPRYTGKRWQDLHEPYTVWLKLKEERLKMEAAFATDE